MTRRGTKKGKLSSCPFVSFADSMSGRPGATAQLAQCGEVDRIHVAGLGRFEDDGHADETRVTEERAEALSADLALADVRVAVHPAALRFETVVDVERP